MRLEKRILIGFAAGVALGGLARVGGLEWLRDATIAIEPIGTAFIRLVTMAVYPLVIASVFCGVASLGDGRLLGRVGGRTLLYFAGTTLAAAAIGLIAAVTFRVGEGLTEAERATLVGQTVAPPSGATPTLVQTLLGMVPQNPFAAAASGDLLALIIAVCIFGAAA